jgi:two-component system response regulator RegX3
MRVLITIADAVARARITQLLTDAGHHVTALATPPKSLDLELELLVLDSAEALSRLRLARPELAMLLITEPGDVDARVLGLQSGADDALGADFAPSQMVARVGALHRRITRAPRPAETLTVDDCHVDLDALTARRGQTTIQLSAREVGIIRWLHAHRERTVTRAELLEHVWGLSPNLETRSVDVAISTLRKKLERDASQPRVIVSVKGLGYRWASTT